MANCNKSPDGKSPSLPPPWHRQWRWPAADPGRHPWGADPGAGEGAAWEIAMEVCWGRHLQNGSKCGIFIDFPYNIYVSLGCLGYPWWKTHIWNFSRSTVGLTAGSSIALKLVTRLDAPNLSNSCEEKSWRTPK